MRKITVFDYMSVDGFFAESNGEWSFFVNVSQDPEFNAFTHEGAKSGGTLIFGRTTYELMKSFWSTPDAVKADPVMAEVMQNNPKIVFFKISAEHRGRSPLEKHHAFS